MSEGNPNDKVASGGSVPVAEVRPASRLVYMLAAKPRILSAALRRYRMTEAGVICIWDRAVDIGAVRGPNGAWQITGRGTTSISPPITGGGGGPGEAGMSDDLGKRLQDALKPHGPGGGGGNGDRDRQLLVAAATALIAKDAEIARWRRLISQESEFLDIVQAKKHDYEAALYSIRRNTCCSGCGEAALVASAALGLPPIEKRGG